MAGWELEGELSTANILPVSKCTLPSYHPYSHQVSTPHEIARDVLEKHMPTESTEGIVSQAAVELKQRLVAHPNPTPNPNPNT